MKKLEPLRFRQAWRKLRYSPSFFLSPPKPLCGSGGGPIRARARIGGARARVGGPGHGLDAGPYGALPGRGRGSALRSGAPVND